MYKRQTTSRSWSDGSADWIGYISPQQLPRVVDPSEGFVVNANNRNVDQNYPFTVGHAFTNGYRAHRITERLHEMDLIDENEMFQLQLDTKVGVYEFYRDIALSVLNSSLLSKRPELQEMRNYLAVSYTHLDHLCFPSCQFNMPILLIGSDSSYREKHWSGSLNIGRKDFQICQHWIFQLIILAQKLQPIREHFCHSFRPKR